MSSSPNGGGLSEQLKKMNLQTKTVGEDRIRKAKERNEDVAILSMELPGENKTFKCTLGEDCFLGDCNTLPLGNMYTTFLLNSIYVLNFVVDFNCFQIF